MNQLKLSKMKLGRISETKLAAVCIVILLVSCIPLIVIAKYNVPCADDFSYGVRMHAEYVKTGSVVQTISAAIEQVKDSYHSWQGTYSAIFLMALQPAVFGEEYYGIGAGIMIASLIIATFFFVIAFLEDGLGLVKVKYVLLHQFGQGFVYNFYH